MDDLKPKKNPTKGLGRGLDALLGNFNEANLQKEYPNYRLELLECEKIKPNPYQPRQFFDEKAIEELAQSIAEQGLLQPVVVVEKNGAYQLIAGERRLRAFKSLGYLQIPALIRSEDEAAQAMWAVIENLQRQDLNCMEEARALKRLMQEFNLSHEQIAKKMGRSRPYVSNMLRLEQAPIGIQELLEKQSIEMGHARALLGLEPAHQMMLAKRVENEMLSVRATEQLVRDWLNKEQLPSVHHDQTAQNTVKNISKNIAENAMLDSSSAIHSIHDIERDLNKNDVNMAQTQQNLLTQNIQEIKETYNAQELEEDISNTLGLLVQIKHEKTGVGQILIHYENLAELDFLIEKLKQ